MKLNKIAALIAIAGLSGSAFATNGYFAHGYGVRASGMGGVGVAVALEPFGGAITWGRAEGAFRLRGRRSRRAPTGRP